MKIISFFRHLSKLAHLNHYYDEVNKYKTSSDITVR